jgi:hypothetical protein
MKEEIMCETDQRSKQMKFMSKRKRRKLNDELVETRRCEPEDVLLFAHDQDQVPSARIRNEEPVPCFEPEVIAAETKRNYGDGDKVATTWVTSLQVHGVAIISRYRKAHEFELMRTIITALPPAARAAVQSIICDSKAGSSFMVTLRDWREALARHIEVTAINCNGGHNGIAVSSKFGDREGIFIEPSWED